MTMPYNPELQHGQTHPYEHTGDQEIDQANRYHNLAEFMWRVAEPEYKEHHTLGTFERDLKAGRMLAADGVVRMDRLQNWADRRGFEANLPDDEYAWERVIEGVS